MGVALFREGLKVEINHDRPLLAYAYLAQTGSQNDILSGLVPIVSPIAQASAGKAFDAKELCEKLKELYGIEIHPWVTEELVPNLVEAQILVPSEVGGSAVKHYYAQAERFESISPIEDEVKILVDSFVSYCRPLIPVDEGFDITFLESVFLNQLVSLDFQSQLLKPGVSKKPELSARPILRLNRDKPASYIPDAEETLRADRLKLLCASFILKLSEDDSELFPFLLRIASGAIAAEYILNLREPNTTTSLKGMKFYLDGPLVMSYLDLSDQLAYSYTTQLIDNLSLKGAILCIFQHHVEEIRDNLKAALARSEQGDGHRATYRRLRNKDFRTYVLSVLGNLEATIRQKKITIIKVPVGAESYFSVESETDLISALGMYSVNARVRDAAAIAAVVRLRKGRLSSRSDFHQAQHIFVTENARVARKGASFLKREGNYRDSDVPAAVTDRHLAGLMFVLFGAQGSMQIAHYKLISNCASALEPSQELLTRVTSFLEGLDANRADHFRAIMTTQRSAQYMTRFMLEQKMSIDNADDAARVLEFLEEQWQSKLKAESDAEICLLLEKHEQTLRLSEEETAEAAAEALRLTEQLVEQQERSRKDQKNSELQIEKLANGLSSVLDAQKEALNRDVATAASQVRALIHKFMVEDQKHQGQIAIAVLVITLIAVIGATIFAFDPSTTIAKISVLALVALATLVGSSWIFKVFNEWNKMRLKKKFNEKFNSDFFIQRYAEHLTVDYDAQKVEVVASAQLGLSEKTGVESITATRN